MKNTFYWIGLIAIFGTAMVSCDTLGNLPTNTTGGVFSLNGKWSLASSSENNAQVGTMINVVPVIGNANVVSLPSTNSYCYKEKDAVWRSITSSGSGGFTVSALVGACNGSINYRDASVAVVNNNEIKVSGKTSSGADLSQSWTRVK